MNHEQYMGRAVEIARGNPDEPFGCVIADQETEEIVAEGLNDVARNPVLHGETAAIINLAESGSSVDRARLTLYTTAEPCPMCAAAILWSEIPRLVIGTSVETLRRLGRPHIAIPVEEVASRASFGELEITHGVLETECDALYEEAARRERGG